MDIFPLSTHRKVYNLSLVSDSARHFQSSFLISSYFPGLDTLETRQNWLFAD